MTEQHQADPGTEGTEETAEKELTVALKPAQVAAVIGAILLIVLLWRRRTARR